MISFIKGIVESLESSQIVIETGGIGYAALVPLGVLTRVKVGADIKLYTYLQAKEDGITLFGFLTQSERSVFLQLIGVTGVGPKASLGLLSALTPEQIILAVVTDDVQALSRAQGIGKKTAGRIVLELKDKMRTTAEADEVGVSNQVAFQTVSGPKQDAIDALTSLGYTRGEAVRSVMEVYLPELTAEQTIKLALKRLT